MWVTINNFIHHLYNAIYQWKLPCNMPVTIVNNGKTSFLNRKCL